MIKSLSLTNWKSHLSSEFKLTNGTNVLIGHMGAGKSSVLQGVSFALFGTFAEIKSRDVKITDLISRNATSHQAEIVLNIKSNQGPLTIHRKIDTKKNSHEATIRDAEGKLLAGPNPTAVNEYIQKLLKVDEAIFLRAVYGMQNDIDGILRLTPTERKRRIDELMGLDKLEVARKSAQTLKGKIALEIDAMQKVISDLASEDIIKQETILKNEIENTQRKQKEIDEELKRKKKLEETSKKELEHLREDARILSRTNEQIRSTKSQINEISLRLMGVNLNQNFNEVEKVEKHLAQKLKKLQESRSLLTKSLSDKNKLLVEVEKNFAVAESKVRGLSEKLGTFQKVELELESIKSKYGVTDLNSEIISIKSEINKKDEQVKMNIAHMESMRRHLEEITSTEGICPLCRTALKEQDRLQVISHIKKELAEILYSNNNANKELDALKEKKAKLEELSEKYNKNIEELANKEKIRTEKNIEDSKVAKFKAKREELKSDIFQLENRLKEIERSLNLISEERSKILESKHLYELKQRRVILEKELSRLEHEKEAYDIPAEKLEKAEEIFQEVLRRVQELRTKKEGFETLLKEKLLRLKELERKKQNLQKLQGNLKKLRSKVEFLEKFKNALQATQLELRDELILTVNEVMSSVWLEIYPYASWSGVRLAVDENDYTLQIKDIEGNWVNVSGFASGGERMLAALAMRISFARVMVPNLSLLILDEPTHNLDEKAVQTLIEVLRDKVSEFIDQILIVTHEGKLAESADNKIQI